MEQKEEKLKLDIQLFADDGEGNTIPPVNDGDGKTKTPTANPLTFEEMLKTENYQSEFDKRVAKALETAKGNWKKDYEAKLQAEKSEAEKLAKMNAEQKSAYEKEQAEKRALEAEAKLNAYELKDQALTLAKEKGLEISLLDMLDFSKEKAETVNAKIENIKTIFDKAVEKAVNDKLKEGTPTQYNASKNEDDDPYIRGFKNA